MKWQNHISVFILVILISSFTYFPGNGTYYFILRPTHILTAFVGLLAIGMIPAISHIKDSYNIRVTQLDVLVCCMFMYIFLRYLFSSEFNISNDSIFFYAFIFISYLYIRFNLQKTKNVSNNSIFFILIACGSIQSIYALFQYFKIIPGAFNYAIGGSFGNPGDLANFTVINYSIVLSLLQLSTKKKVKLLLGVVLLLHIFVLTVSLARTAWVAAIFTSLLVLIIHYARFLRKTSNKKIRIGIVLVLIILAPIAIYFAYGLKPSSAMGRAFIWKLTTEKIIEKPFFGYGYDSFVPIFRQKQIEYFKSNPEDFKNGKLAGEPHFAFNDYLHFSLEYGFVFLLIFLLILFELFKSKENSNHELCKDHLIICKQTIVALLICMCFSYPLKNHAIFFYLIILLAICSTRSSKTLFEFPVNSLVRIPLLVLYLFFLIVFTIQVHNKIKYGKLWKSAWTEFQNGSEGYLENYEKLYPYMKGNNSFLLNYGAMLLAKGEYERCADHYNQYGYLIQTTNMYIMQGTANERMKNYEQALLNYESASNLIPHKFTPQYKLFKLYKKLGEQESADSIAIQIKNSPIKIYSEEVREMKSEVNEYVYNRKHNNE